MSKIELKYGKQKPEPEASITASDLMGLSAFISRHARSVAARALDMLRLHSIKLDSKVPDTVGEIVAHLSMMAAQARSDGMLGAASSSGKSFRFENGPFVAGVRKWPAGRAFSIEVMFYWVRSNQ